MKAYVRAWFDQTVAQEPVLGFNYCFKDHWWCASEKGLLLTREVTTKIRTNYDPVCNLHHAVLKMLRDKFYPNTDIIQVPAVFVLVDHDDRFLFPTSAVEEENEDIS